MNARLSLKLLVTALLACAAVTQSSSAAADEAVRRWLAQSAIRLNTVEAGHGFADMQPLKKVVGDARIVSLGEATHGTREFFQLKHRMLEFLVTEMGFTLFAIEATMPESFDINEYVLGGTGDPAKALAGIYFWTWDTEEVLEMIKWMRQYNADPGHTRKVKFYGFDMQSAPRAAIVTLAYLRKVDAAQAGVAERDLSVLANPLTDTGFTRLAPDKRAAADETIKAVLSGFDARKEQYIARSSADEWQVARQHARVLAQNIDSRKGDEFSVAGVVVRDRSMAVNIGWILDREGPDAKMVVWAHNGHVATTSTSGIEWMGSHLRKRFGSAMVVFGFAFNQGSFQALEMPLPSATGLRSFTVEPAAEGSLEAMLASAGLQIAAIDLRALPRDGAVADWFGSPKATRSIGAAYADSMAARLTARDVTPKIYDALLFVATTTTARSVNKADVPGPPQKFPSLANAGFEDVDALGVPSQWRFAPKLRRFDFQIATSDDRPHSGSRSAAISRPVGRHYGETIGVLDQRIDATPYRGKTIRLRAAARADASTRSWLRLTVARKVFGPQAVAFDSLDAHPVVSPDWRVYDITADVPEDADAIAYGLALVGDGKAWLDTVSIDVVEKR